MKQCSVLIVNCNGRETVHRQALARRGFRVDQIDEWPSDEDVLRYEVVVVILRHLESISMLAARMRAKPRFGNRVLIAVNLTPPSPDERRTAIDAGFDDIVAETTDSRMLIARILRRLRARPEHRCLVPERRRPAA